MLISAASHELNRRCQWIQLVTMDTTAIALGMALPYGPNGPLSKQYSIPPLSAVPRDEDLVFFMQMCAVRTIHGPVFPVMVPAKRNRPAYNRVASLFLGHITPLLAYSQTFGLFLSPFANAWMNASVLLFITVSLFHISFEIEQDQRINT